MDPPPPPIKPDSTQADQSSPSKSPKAPHKSVSWSPNLTTEATIRESNPRSPSAISDLLPSNRILDFEEDSRIFLILFFFVLDLQIRWTRFAMCSDGGGRRWERPRRRPRTWPGMSGNTVSFPRWSLRIELLLNCVGMRLGFECFVWAVSCALVNDGGRLIWEVVAELMIWEADHVDWICFENFDEELVWSFWVLAILNIMTEESAELKVKWEIEKISQKLLVWKFLKNLIIGSFLVWNVW